MRLRESKKRSWPTQVMISFFLLIFCIFLRLSPEDAFIKTKNSIRTILTTNSDVKAEWQKLKGRFKREEEIASYAPVSGMTAPTKGKILKGFGAQDASETDFHYGVVVSCNANENILAANEGEVTEVATNAEYGSFVIIQHSEEIATLYGNLNEIFPNVGEKIEKGQPVGRPENGESFYFELRRGETFLDPTEFITFGAADHD